MSVQVMLLMYGFLMLALALIVRWEGIRNRKGPILNPGDPRDLSSSRLPYTPPPDRSKRSFYRVRR